MAQTVKNLLKISIGIRGLGVSSNYTMTKRYIGMSVQCTTNFKRDDKDKKYQSISPESLVAPQPLPFRENYQDHQSVESVQDSLKGSTFPEEVFKIVDLNVPRMTVRNAVTALKILMKLEKDQGRRIQNVHKNPSFLALCEILNKNATRMNPAECLAALRAMIHFKVPTTSVIVQVILQMLRSCLNELSLSELSSLHSLLMNCDCVPLVEALRVAVPIVYEANLSTKLDPDDLSSAANAMFFLSSKTRNPKTFDILLNALMTCKQPMDINSAQHLLFCLCQMKYHPTDLPQVLDHVQDFLAQNIKSLDQETIIKLTRRIADKLRERTSFYYHEGFVDACALAAISENWEFTDAISLLTQLSRIRHTQISLLDYIAGKCFTDPNLLANCPPSHIAVLVEGFSLADYKPVFWDNVQMAVMTKEFFNANYPLPELAVNLLSLDCYWPKLLTKAFGNYDAVKFASMRNKRTTLLMYQTLTTLYPQYPIPYTDDEISELIDAVYKPMEFPLLSSLQSALGGPGYVLTNIRSKFGHRIDHAVAMRKGGFPIAINEVSNYSTDTSEVIQLEDIKLPDDGKIILILNIPFHGYSINTQRLTGACQLQIKSLEVGSGHTVIPILPCTWKNLTTDGRIRYLMQAIRLKCDDLSLTANS